MPKLAKTRNLEVIPPRLPTPSRKILEAQWQTAFGRPLSPKTRRPLAAQLLRFHAQETAHGGLPAEVEAYLVSLLPRTRGSGPQTAPAPARRLKPGTRLLRTWQGRTYTVIVAEPGFLYEGTTYSSLSVVAREITGTPWSGPAFFGLNKAKPAKASA
jgi:hypothetical protein